MYIHATTIDTMTGTIVSNKIMVGGVSPLSGTRLTEEEVARRFTAVYCHHALAHVRGDGVPQDCVLVSAHNESPDRMTLKFRDTAGNLYIEKFALVRDPT